jgi:hypothetical protein
MMNPEQKPSAASEYDALFEQIRGIAIDLQALHQQALLQHTPIVEEIIRTGSSDTKLIEQTLDGLLNSCGYVPAVEVFRKLCKYYWQIDPHATISYVQAYREMWDSDS